MGEKITDEDIKRAITDEIRTILREMDPDESIVEFMAREPVKAAVVMGWLLDRFKDERDDGFVIKTIAAHRLFSESLAGFENRC